MAPIISVVSFYWHISLARKMSAELRMNWENHNWHNLNWVGAGSFKNEIFGFQLYWCAFIYLVLLLSLVKVLTDFSAILRKLQQCRENFWILNYLLIRSEAQLPQYDFLWSNRFFAWLIALYSSLKHFLPFYHLHFETKPSSISFPSHTTSSLLTIILSFRHTYLWIHLLQQAAP